MVAGRRALKAPRMPIGSLSSDDGGIIARVSSDDGGSQQRQSALVSVITNGAPTLSAEREERERAKLSTRHEDVIERAVEDRERRHLLRKYLDLAATLDPEHVKREALWRQRMVRQREHEDEAARWEREQGCAIHVVRAAGHRQPLHPSDTRFAPPTAAGAVLSLESTAESAGQLSATTLRRHRARKHLRAITDTWPTTANFAPGTRDVLRARGAAIRREAAEAQLRGDEGASGRASCQASAVEAPCWWRADAAAPYRDAVYGALRGSGAAGAPRTIQWDPAEGEGAAWAAYALDEVARTWPHQPASISAASIEWPGHVASGEWPGHVASGGGTAPGKPSSASAPHRSVGSRGRRDAAAAIDGLLAAPARFTLTELRRGDGVEDEVERLYTPRTAAVAHCSLQQCRRAATPASNAAATAAATTDAAATAAATTDAAATAAAAADSDAADTATAARPAAQRPPPQRQPPQQDVWVERLQPGFYHATHPAACGSLDPPDELDVAAVEAAVAAEAEAAAVADEAAADVAARMHASRWLAIEDRDWSMRARAAHEGDALELHAPEPAELCGEHDCGDGPREQLHPTFGGGGHGWDPSEQPAGPGAAAHANARPAPTPVDTRTPAARHAAAEQARLHRAARMAVEAASVHLTDTYCLQRHPSAAGFTQYLETHVTKSYVADSTSRQHVQLATAQQGRPAAVAARRQQEEPRHLREPQLRRYVYRPAAGSFFPTIPMHQPFLDVPLDAA